MTTPDETPPAGRARRNLYGLDRDAIARVLAPFGARPFHADQVYHWMYGRRVASFEAMTDLSLALRRAIDARWSIRVPVAREAARSADASRKYVLALEDGLEVEAVHMTHDGRVTFCLSSQVGCPLDCRFCLTGTMGLVRQLDAGEIAGQVEALARAGDVDPVRLRIVFMGMGEPLANYAAVMRAFRILTDPRGYAIPARRITLSTAGLVPGIERLGRESPRPRLAISLGAATDAARDRLMPINRTFDLQALAGALRSFPLGPRERITFEYVLLAGVNDQRRDAAAVARLVHGLRAKVNVIPYNETGLGGFRTPGAAGAAAFRDWLLGRGVPASIRWSKGRDIGAACGQLARARPPGDAAGPAPAGAAPSG